MSKTKPRVFHVKGDVNEGPMWWSFTPTKGDFQLVLKSDYDELLKEREDALREAEKEINILKEKLEITILTLQDIANEDFRGNRPSGAVKAYECIKSLKEMRGEK